MTTDAGLTWTNVSGEIPDVPVTALVPAPGDPRELFAATDVGVFRTTNGGASWSAFSAGLPNTTVSSLAFRPGTRDLVAATYGRGMWTIAVPPAGGDGPPVAAFAVRPALPAPGQSVAFSDLSSGEPSSWLWSFGDGGTSTEKSPRHVFASAGTFLRDAHGDERERPGLDDAERGRDGRGRATRSRSRCRSSSTSSASRRRTTPPT